MMHYVYPLNDIAPPCKRCPEELPEQWKNYIHPSELTPVKAPNSMIKVRVDKYETLVYYLL